MLEKIKEKKCKVGVIGLGYVGLPLAIEFLKNNFSVVGFDVSKDKCDLLNKRQSYIDDISNDELESIFEKQNFLATTDFSKLSDMDSIHICVPTPLIKTSDPDMSHIIAVCSELKKFLKKNTLIVLESTTYPGTTREMFEPLMKSLGFVIGKDVFVAFSPERIDPGNKEYAIHNTPKIIGGITKKCLIMAQALYLNIVNQVVRMSSTEAAEMVKLLENTYRSVNIALANELAQMCKILNLDSHEIINAAASKPFGYMPFYPGPGLGGHCIPIDPHYLSWKLKTLNYQTRFIDLASKINTEMPNYVVSLVQDQLNKTKKSINGAKILLLGISYKPNISDVRESPAIDIYKILNEKGAKISYHDPLVSKFKFEGKALKTTKLTAEKIKNHDLVLICTKHDVMDIELIVEHANMILDTRNATQGFNSNKIVRI